MRLFLAALALFATPAAADWQATLDAARGQTVYWHAWGGDQRTNDFIAWVGQEAERRHGVTVEQVKLSDTAEAVARVIAEKAAGVTEGGAVDLIWINGPNFLAMKDQGLLHGPFVTDQEVEEVCKHLRGQGEPEYLEAITDGGGKTAAATEPLIGSHAIAEFFAGIFERQPNLQVEIATVNDEPGLIGMAGDQIISVISTSVRSGVIHNIWAMRNPDKLRAWFKGD
jgi:hypothetical protein